MLLLLAGGLGALQAATLVAALPFCFIMILLAFALVRQANADAAGDTIPSDTAPISERLKRLITPASHREIVHQIARNGLPALQSVRDAMVEEGLADSSIDEEDGAAFLSIGLETGQRFVYRLAPRPRPAPVFTAMDAPEGRRTLQWWLAAQTDGAGKPRDLTGFTQDQIASDLLEQLERWRVR